MDRILYFYFIFALWSCSHSSIKFDDIQTLEYDNIPSGSGMSKVGDFLYIVGDDSPYLFVLDSNFSIVNQIPLIDTSGYDGGRLPKKNKPDFEAMERISDTEIIIFGSGSKSPTRDVMILVSIQDSITFESFVITDFYNNLRNLSEMKTAELNIEAAAFWNGHLSLFNRSNNLIFTFEYASLIEQIKAGKLPKIKNITSIELPAINHISSGFSGAEGCEDENMILFTSSVEGTEDSYHDGEIYGSFIGVLRLELGKIKYFDEIVRVSDQGRPQKVESITKVASFSKNKIKINAVTDNDDGKSNIFIGNLLIK